MIVLNFAHPLSAAQIARVEELCGGTVERVIEQAAQFDEARPFAAQAAELVDGAGLSSEEWQTAALLANLPSLSAIAAVVLAELHGRMGYFPDILRLRRIPDSTPPVFEVAEILRLQQIRDTSRTQR